jgi:hypothetical protein
MPNATLSSSSSSSSALPLLLLLLLLLLPVCVQQLCLNCCHLLLSQLR